MMPKKRIFKTGVALIGASLGAYYNKEIQDCSIGVFRFAKTATTVAEILIDYKNTIYSKTIDISSKEYPKIRSDVHLRSAQRLLKLCEKHGGAFIKVGQHLGALDYLIPAEYVSTMKVLHSQAPQSTYDEVLKVIKEDLKCDPTSVFRTIEKIPLGTASLAQVHKAELNDGTVVAVKVQHPLVKSYSTIDIKSMEILVDFASWVFPDLKLDWLVRETKKTLPFELNFLLEGKNSEKTAALMKHLPWLNIPKVFWDYSTSRVLTMEYCGGYEIAALGQGKRAEFEPFKKEISQKITQMYSDMIFLHGYVHCDPHHGNLKIELTDKKQIVIHLLDHGLYAQLPLEFRENYAKFWMSIIHANVQEMQEHSEKLGVKELYSYFACMVAGRSMTSVLGGKVKKTKTSEEEKQIKIDASVYLNEIMEVLHQVPSEMLFILKTNDLLRGLNSTLGVNDNITSFATMSRSCANANFIKEYQQCKSLPHKLRVVLSHYVAYFKITTYEILLWWTSLLNLY
ncbi:aarF domain-containing kinase 1-like [Daphnia pulicaria]|uniref:aarF domain-containing kinase 1-like n=1 Tax=Daphnia pulicaria TaxID=35523 RepID=UPI001EEBE620|nr:aarF domain-containing kinase 1-like [Daphnia pulicaria]